jgi:excisionase family DNA binding protein
MTPFHTPQAAPEPIIYVRPGELAERLGISRETVRRMAREGRIPFIRIGTAVRFNVDEVLRHLGAK